MPELKEENKIAVLLSEYEACHDTRDHYDNVCWTIGSIFIAISLAIFGLSFTQEVMYKSFMVILLAASSLSMLLIWYIFVQHVYPYVWLAVVRCHKIEVDLRGMGYNIWLHKSINKYKQTLKGNRIVFAICLLLSLAWFFRIILLMPRFYLVFFNSIIFGVLISILFIYHFFFAKNDWGLEIQRILDEEERQELTKIDIEIKKFGEKIKEKCVSNNELEIASDIEDFRQSIVERIKNLLGE